jgi:hypothetical protein
MSALLIDDQPLHPHVRAVVDGRPPGRTWSRTGVLRPDQPTLAFEPVASVGLGPPQPTGHDVHVVSRPWSADPSSVLPNARTWSASLALAFAETLQGRRPVGQLSRWVDDRVLATLTVSLRRRRPAPGRLDAAPVPPATLRSVHLQCPTSDAVEASAHVQMGGRSAALAFRLEAWYDRWLCTALELGPRGWMADGI